MEISRDKYLNDLIVRKGNGMIKVITGIRRCGKTYLVFELFVRHLLESGAIGIQMPSTSTCSTESGRMTEPTMSFSTRFSTPSARASLRARTSRQRCTAS